MKKVLFVVSMLLIWLVSPLLAQEHFFDNGFYLGLGPNASFMSRQKKINYGLSDSTAPLSATGIKDAQPSPAVTVGYKFSNADSVSLRGEWAHYSGGRNFTTSPDFGVVAVDGSFNSIDDGNSPGSDGTVNIEWKSKAYNVELEYQRLLWSDNIGGVLAILGFRYRFEGQKFDAVGADADTGGLGTLDILNEKLTEHLYGPYAGIKLSFKPMADSKINIKVKTNVGFLFKSADFRAREVFDPDGSFVGPLPIARDDHSSKGTAFTTVTLGVIYSMTKNWQVGAHYGFNWIGKSAHIFNPKADLVPASIIDSTVLTHIVGMKITYKF